MIHQREDLAGRNEKTVAPRTAELLRDHLAVGLIVVCSGAVYFAKIHYSATILVLLLVAIVFYLPRRLGRAATITLIFFLSLVLVNLVIYSRNPSGHAGLIVKLLAVFLVMQRIDLERAARAFVNVMAFLAAASLPFYFFGLQFPELVRQSIPLSAAWGGFYRVTPLYVYGEYTLDRNQGIFWEPGAYQAFLNLALLVALFGKKGEGRFRMALLVVALITTYSTTGYLTAMVFVAAAAVRRSMTASVPASKVVARLAALLVVPALVLTSPVVVDKFASTNASYARRSLDWQSALSLAFERPLLGWGYQNNAILEQRFHIPDVSNSLFAFAFQFGLPALILLSLGIICGVASVVDGIGAALLVVAGIALIVTTENLLLQPVILSLIFLGARRFDDSDVHRSGSRPRRERRALEDRTASMAGNV